MYKLLKVSLRSGEYVVAARPANHHPTDAQLAEAHANTAIHAEAASAPGNYGSRPILPIGSQSDVFASVQMHIDLEFPGMRIDSIAGVGRFPPAPREQVPACIGHGWSCLHAADTFDGIVEHVAITSGYYVPRAQIIDAIAQLIASKAADNGISPAALASIVTETVPREISAAITDSIKRI